MMRCIDCGKQMDIDRDKWYSQMRRCSRCYKSYKKVSASWELKRRTGTLFKF